MNDSPDRDRRPIRMGLWLSLLIAGWTAVVAGLAAVNVTHERRETDTLALLMARNEARVAFDAALLFHEWAAEQGGIWVASGTRPSHPVHAEPPMASGDSELTYQSPAAMSREALKLSLRGSLIQGELISTDPDDSSPSPWWKGEALARFDDGKHEFVSLDDDSDDGELVLVRPLMASYSCLGCHPGRHEGDLLGAIAFTVPMGLARASAGERPMSSIASFYFIVWLAGAFGIALWGSALKRQLARI